MKVLRYGLIGCGGFGRFCLQEYRKMPNVECIAVADSDEALARRTAEEQELGFEVSPEALLRRAEIDLVHIATPPFTHSALAMAALEAGKHVLCEKPLALTVEDAERMIALAEEKGLILAVNLIMRYNPLCLAVKALVDTRVLGEPLYASLVNAAKDESLGLEHWFWDREKSGGIFIEHGVHFFDLFEWWFGPGKVLSAEQLYRPGTGIVDQVHCAVRYGESTLGTFYHGFHQMNRRDEQNWRIVFELGTLTMSEWVPTRLEIDMTVSDAALEVVKELLPRADVRELERYEGAERDAMSRHRERIVDVHAKVSADAGAMKMDLYGQMLRTLLDDQISAIRDAAYVRRVSERNGLSSLAYAVEAQRKAGAI